MSYRSFEKEEERERERRRALRLLSFERFSVSRAVPSYCIRALCNIIIQIGGCSVKAIPAQMDNSCTLSGNVELHYVNSPWRIARICMYV